MLKLLALESLHRGNMLAAELPCAGSSLSAWLGVYPLDLSSAATRQFLQSRGLEIFPAAGHAYHLRVFEVRRALLATDASVSEKDLSNKRSMFVFTDEDLPKQIEALGISIESLDLPSESDYPI
jgi:hypothetical protein